MFIEISPETLTESGNILTVRVGEIDMELEVRAIGARNEYTVSVYVAGEQQCWLGDIFVESANVKEALAKLKGDK